MTTSSQIRQSFLDFFHEKQHTIVPSGSLLPDSPNLLFTNAGMNQFVPIFLGERKADVSKWGGAVPSLDTRAADTQKCIRAGGKHNDLDDVGLDTYHHTFFEMLGNWSFGDYFKKEAIEWAWELIVDRWKFPPQRLYATIYSPDKALGDPAERDEEAWGIWAEKFRGVGLDPEVHIVNGNKKDNFWMMGDTGPCGPCSELHVDLTQNGDTKGALVNKGSSECIEIWNLVFIQFNANVDGTFSPLPAKHVDTGMGFERVASIIQCTKNFTDFGTTISNYETDIFRPIFDEIEKLSGKKYHSTLPRAGSTGENDREKEDVAFRVIADHIRTLSFSIADNIQPGNNDRNYVLRRILRRAVKYGRTLGFREPFFYKLVDVLARKFGEVFPEIRAKQKHVEEVLKREEEAFNRTLDKGIDLFEREASRIAGAGSARAPRADSGAPPESQPSAEGARYSRRNLPHFERPYAKYMVTFTSRDRDPFTSEEKDLILRTILHDNGKKYDLMAACVMRDHAHILIEPSHIATAPGEPSKFYSLSEILQTLKSVSAHGINKLRKTSGAVWEAESFDRLIRSDSDLEEKFIYIVENPRRDGLVAPDESYRWIWTPDYQSVASQGAEEGPRRGAEDDTRGACAPQQQRTISGAFAFRLYDEQGFPLDLTELLARERGLSVAVDEFHDLMEQQKARARAAQKKTVIELSEVETKTPTHFLGYDHAHIGADVQEVLSVKGKTAVIANNSVCYAEMGGQVGDTGEMTSSGRLWRIANTQKSGNTWLHFLEDADAPEVGSHVTITLDATRRAAIQRHHTATHLLHWALHEVVSKEATQKGSSVAPDKLTFDFNSGALTPSQVRDIERLVNERIVGNDLVSWTEVPYADVRGRADIMQFFGDKYGETVRVVQIGGSATVLDGYSMELCAGTHTRATGEIGLFRINAEAAIAAGVRRIEAVTGLHAYDFATADTRRLHELAAKIGAPLADMEKRLEGILAQQKELEKAVKAANQREAVVRAKKLLEEPESFGGIPSIIVNLGETDGDTLQSIADALKSLGFKGVVILGGSANGAVALVASVSADFTIRAQAGKIIQTIAPIVGGKGGGKPDNARGGGKDPAKLDEALNFAKGLYGG